MEEATPRAAFWRTFLSAAEAEPIEAKTMVGASGFEHRLLAAGVDRTRKRLVLVSSEADARIAALAQADIQSAAREYRVVGARPIALNLAAVASLITDSIGTVRLGQKQFSMMKRKPEVFKRALGLFAKRHEARIKRMLFQANEIAELNLFTVWQEVLHQVSLVEVDVNDSFADGEKAEVHDVELGRLIALDPAESDRRQGVCPIPLYDFDPGDIEVFHSGNSIEAAKDVLRHHQILQYFFPSPDHTALGLVGCLTADSQDVETTIKELPAFGHPLSPNELVDPAVQVRDVIDALKDSGYVAEGEFGVEITPTGRTVRYGVQFKPRESIFAKIARLITVKIDLNLGDLLK